MWQRDFPTFWQRDNAQMINLLTFSPSEAASMLFTKTPRSLEQILLQSEQPQKPVSYKSNSETLNWWRHMCVCLHSSLSVWETSPQSLVFSPPRSRRAFDQLPRLYFQVGLSSHSKFHLDIGYLLVDKPRWIAKNFWSRKFPEEVGKPY